MPLHSREKGNLRRLNLFNFARVKSGCQHIAGLGYMTSRSWRERERASSRFHRKSLNACNLQIYNNIGYAVAICQAMRHETVVYKWHFKGNLLWDKTHWHIYVLTSTDKLHGDDPVTRDICKMDKYPSARLLLTSSCTESTMARSTGWMCQSSMAKSPRVLQVLCVSCSCCAHRITTSDWKLSVWKQPPSCASKKLWKLCMCTSQAFWSWIKLKSKDT